MKYSEIHAFPEKPYSVFLNVTKYLVRNMFTEQLLMLFLNDVSFSIKISMGKKIFHACKMLLWMTFGFFIS